MYTERMERFKAYFYSKSDEQKDDQEQEFCKKIQSLLDVSCEYVDAYYYDFSALPEDLKGVFYRDMYLLFGITEKAQIVTKWIERYEFDK